MGYVQTFRDKIISNLFDSGTVDVISIDYLELGSGTTPFSLNDTALETPFFRKAIASKTIKLTELDSLIDILSSEGNSQDIHEIGIYSGGTIAIGSGSLVSRIVFDAVLPKTSANTLNIYRKDKVNI